MSEGLTMFMQSRFAPLLAAMALGGCVVMPSGPGIMALPGSNKSFDQFRADDANCRGYAYAQVGGQSSYQAAQDSAVGSAVVGTVIGAIAGAAIDGSRGAGSGAAAGLVLGSMAGTGAAQTSAYGTQRRYDQAYIQCMYAQGHQVPVRGRLTGAERAPVYYPPPPGAATPSYPPPPSYQPPPPPPPGAPPPPPPGYR